MEVGAGNPACGTGFAELLAALYGVAFVHCELREMHIDGEETLTVVEDYAVAFKEKVSGENHRAGVRSQNWSTGGGAEIYAVMFAKKLAVEHSAHAEGFRDERVERLVEGAGPERVRTGFCVGGGFRGFFFVDALEECGIGAGVAAFDGERFRGGDDFAFLDGDADFLREGYGRTGGGFAFESERVLAFGGCERCASDCDPGAAFVEGFKLEWVIEPLAVEFREAGAGADLEEAGSAVDGMRWAAFDFEMDGFRCCDSHGAQHAENETFDRERAGGGAENQAPILHRMLRF